MVHLGSGGVSGKSVCVCLVLLPRLQQSQAKQSILLERGRRGDEGIWHHLTIVWMMSHPLSAAIQTKHYIISNSTAVAMFTDAYVILYDVLWFAYANGGEDYLALLQAKLYY